MNFEIPSGLTELLQEFTVAVLRQKPQDLYQFAAEYFATASNSRKSDNKKKVVVFNSKKRDDLSDEECMGEFDFFLKGFLVLLRNTPKSGSRCRLLTV
ncbi:hypothetical protein HELRODRAFT_117221 [Helobdella robusta]|uniref:RIIa domain-containing protein n=1 Tax=Helobdella robusta TaxID=6412 RepID=T1EGL2_HELRO|nr:hypothetical protein HELRODRAFT_117221 [Helobdella robusta]ESO07059.1 hypothetical protein HELRODRAFT_117221 [Helobdella robusta]